MNLAVDSRGPRGSLFSHHFAFISPQKKIYLKLHLALLNVYTAHTRYFIVSSSIKTSHIFLKASKVWHFLEGV